MADELDAILRAIDDEATVRDLLGVIAVATGAEALARLPVVHRFMAAVEREAGGDLERYFALHPLPPQLLKDVERLVRAELASGTLPATIDRVTGRTTSLRPAGADAPAGTFRGGVFARVAVTSKSPRRTP